MSILGLSGLQRAERLLELEAKKKRADQEYMLKELQMPMPESEPYWAVCSMQNQKMIRYSFGQPQMLVEFNSLGQVSNIQLIGELRFRIVKLPIGYNYFDKTVIAWLQSQLE